MKNSPLIEFSPLDSLFAERMLKKFGAYTEERALFLKQLMQSAKKGDLCFHCPDAPPLPLSLMEEGTAVFPHAPVVKFEDSYYLQKNWVYETTLIQQVQRLKKSSPPSYCDEIRFKSEVEKAVKEGKLLPQQEKAVLHAFENLFSLITGGPGTGKTYTAGYFVRFLLASLNREIKKGFRITLAAPTGKAASHLERTLKSQGPLPPFLQLETTTLHRLLKLQPGEIRLFSQRKIDADLILVDEASMMDAPLLAHLLEAVSGRLVLMGDPDQLPPIGSGAPFADMAALFAIPLSRSMRVENSHLQELADAIQSGQMHPLLQKHGSFEQHFKERLYQSANPYLSPEKPDPALLLSNLNSFRILGALRQGPFGIDALNREILQEMSRRIRPGWWWAVPILITSNEPRYDLYNGSCGVLIGKCSGSFNLKEGMAYFPDGKEMKTFPSFETAFCLSIHKSQGSEFEKALLLFPEGSENFGREALYTAVTRAKKEIEIIAEKEVLQKMLQQQSQKLSGFKERFLRARSESADKS